MATIVRDPILEKRILLERAQRGGDRYDEVWEGVYIMAPMPNDEHQMLVGRLTRIFDEIIGDQGLGQVRPGVNVSDRLDGWQQNYRIPDVAVFRNDTTAVNHESFWYGGPDLAVEILSPGDQARDKIPFYAAVKSRELLIVDRDPWQLELYELNGTVMKLVATSSPSKRNVSKRSKSTAAEIKSVTSKVTSLVFHLVEAEGRPRIHVAHGRLDKQWEI